jgi:heme/copper-type cytochrome/quinol oxidase subunit 2
MMLSGTLTPAIVVFVPALVLLFVAFYRRLPGAGGPSLGDGAGVYGIALVIGAVLIVIVFGVLRMRSLGSP